MGIKVSGSALLRNSEDFLSLLSDMILEPKFDDLQLLYSLLMQVWVFLFLNFFLKSFLKSISFLFFFFVA